jgi:hypothetical protein
MLPFTRDEFFLLFATYNGDIWPIQLVALGLGGSATALALWPRSYLHRAVWLAVASMWIWTGAVYHIVYFSVINPIAYVFGALFVLHGFLLFRSGVRIDGLPFANQWKDAQWVGMGLMVFSAIVYPALGVMSGHVFPSAPSFGVTPCPLTIFTFGLTMMTRAPAPSVLLIVPVIWSVIGGTAAIFLGVYEDFALFISAVAVVVLTWRRNRPPFGARRVV